MARAELRGTYLANPLIPLYEWLTIRPRPAIEAIRWSSRYPSSGFLWIRSIPDCFLVR